MSERWPEEFETLYPKLEFAWKLSAPIELRRELGGKSGARIYEADVSSPVHDGTAIIKLGRLVTWENESSELERHLDAWTDATEYVRGHIPHVLLHHIEDEQLALVLSIAGGDLSETVPVAQLGTAQRQRVFRTVGRELIQKWNTDHSVASAGTTAPHALQEWLGYRLDPIRGGRIRDFLQRCSIAPEEPSFSALGEWLPNPFAFAVRDDLWGDPYPFRKIRGRSHRDLHGRNILYQTLGIREERYYLIDLALYERDSLLFYDQAYLEFSHLLEQRATASGARWWSMISALLGEEVFSADFERVETEDKGILDEIHELRQGTAEASLERFSGRFADVKRQALLARVAVGLNFVNKSGLDSHARKLAFVYAAGCLRTYLQLMAIKWIPEGSILKFETEKHSPLGSTWRQVWDAVRGFSANERLVLVAGPQLAASPADTLSSLGRVPWNMVIDFDPDSTVSGVYGAACAALQAHRAIRRQPGAVNFDEATRWIGLVDAETTATTAGVDLWRRRYRKQLRAELAEMRKALAPNRILVFWAADGLSDSLARVIWETLDEELGELDRHVFVRNPGSTADWMGADNFDVVHCAQNEWLAGLNEMLLTPVDSDEVRVPHRRDGTVSLRALSPEQTRNLEEDLEIVHDGLASRVPADREVARDFWRGHEIIWAELEMNADVDRDLLQALHAAFRAAVEKHGSSSVVLSHAPGAGGTTLAKRFAWELKSEFPTVRLRNLSPQTVIRIGWLFNETQLPVIVVAETNVLPPTTRDALVRELERENVRAFMLYVRRELAPRGPLALSDGMRGDDVTRFTDHYSKVALPAKRDDVRRLGLEPSLRDLRSPFFYGLFAFDADFVHVPEYVAARLESNSEESERLLLFLSLVGRYSQDRITDALIRSLLGLSPTNRFDLDTLLPEGPRSLLLHSDHATRVSHPRIAGEILRQLGGIEKKADAAKLADLSIDFIESLSTSDAKDSAEAGTLLEHLFIARTPWGDEENRKTNFSELILDIDSRAAQHRVLRKLVEKYPDNPHLWNHLGRHHSYVLHSPYEKGVEALNAAIALDDTNDIHHHALGMVYRVEVRRRLLAHRRAASVEDALRDIDPVFDEACSCFATARRLAPDGEHGYISEIQMITRSINSLLRISGEAKERFFAGSTRVGDWSRNQFARAQDLLRRVKILRAQSPPSKYVTESEGYLLKLLPTLHAIVESLQVLLHRTQGSGKLGVRRMLAESYYAEREFDWGKLKVSDQRQISRLMRENLSEGSLNSHDLWMWFQAERRQPTFDIWDAIDRYQRLLVREDSVEAHYYLYILHLLLWLNGEYTDTRDVADKIRLCVETAGRMTKSSSDEWLGKGQKYSLAHSSEMRPWEGGFFTRPQPLGWARGIIMPNLRPQAGTIRLLPNVESSYRPTDADRIEAFFVPGYEFISPVDDGKLIQFHLGFSYRGLRAWKPRRIAPDAQRLSSA